MKSNPLVSVITPTYNRPDWLPLTLNSLLGQTYQNWECIVQNDFGVSAEGIIKRINDKRIRYFENESNLDLAGTRNEAMKNARGDYFIFLDDDDQLYNETIEFRVGRIKKLGVDVVYSRVLQNFYKPTNKGYEYAGEKLYWDSIFNRDLLLIQNICPVNAVLSSRRANEYAGKFDTLLHTSEDWSHWVEMSRRFDFFETKIIDCQCSHRLDNTQMTGSRTGFADHLPYLYAKWRKYAINKEFVIEGQNNILRRAGINPEDYGL